MAFALTRYSARGLNITSPVYKQGVQEVVLGITGTAADVDLDIGDDGGTFWTDAEANTTYGELATNALASLKRIVGNSEALQAVQSQQLLDRIQIATPAGAGEFSLAIQDKRPNIAFFAGDGETSYLIVLRYELNQAAPIEFAQYGESTY